MSTFYCGRVDVMLIDSDGSERLTSFVTVLNEIVPGVFELSTPLHLPTAGSVQSICLTLDDGQTLGGDVQVISNGGMTFTLPQGPSY